MSEIKIDLNEVSLQDFYGTNNKHLKQIRQYFPKIKIVARDNQLQAVGNHEILSELENKIGQIKEHLRRFNKITTKEINFILENVDQPINSFVDGILVHGIGGKLIKAQSKGQKGIVSSIAKNDMVFAIGPAGTGKTYTAVALAVKALKNKEVKKIILTRPAVEAGENLGFLPGDLKEKLDPYMQPLYDGLRDMIHFEKLNAYMEKSIVEIAPLAFMRGRTLDNAFVILDEAQNTTTAQMKMFLTRMGRNAKFVITGDLGQIDLPRNQNSGLKQAVSLLKNVAGIGYIELDEKDVMRHELVSKIIKAYKI